MLDGGSLPVSRILQSELCLIIFLKLNVSWSIYFWDGGFMLLGLLGHLFKHQCCWFCFILEGCWCRFSVELTVNIILNACRAVNRALMRGPGLVQSSKRHKMRAFEAPGLDKIFVGLPIWGPYYARPSYFSYLYVILFDIYLSLFKVRFFCRFLCDY